MITVLLCLKSQCTPLGRHMHLYIKGKENGRMMLNSIDNDPLVYGTIEEDGVTRPKKYEELTDAEKLQDDCDVKATNIILQGLPLEVQYEAHVTEVRLMRERFPDLLALIATNPHISSYQTNLQSQYNSTHYQ
ncbi:hypothetical protein Tco_1065722 [Tanacetum coccineum]